MNTLKHLFLITGVLMMSGFIQQIHAADLEAKLMEALKKAGWDTSLP